MKTFLLLALACLSFPNLCFASDSDHRSTGRKIYDSKELGWKPKQNVSSAFSKFLKSGMLKQGDELRLRETYRIEGSHKLPDGITLSATKGAGFEVTDPKNNRALLELGNGSTLRNLSITFLDTPPLGPTGGKHGVHFTKRIGVLAKNKKNIRIANCKLSGSIGHHIKLSGCKKVDVVETHMAGGHWTVLLSACENITFLRCLIEKSQGDGIKTGGGELGIVKKVLVDNCVFQDNLRDGIDTTGGFNSSTVKNCIFRRLGVSGLDLKSHYESKSGRIDKLEPENVGILIEKCLFHDLPNGVVLTTVDCGRRRGEGNELLNAKNMKKYAPHDIDINNCIFGHAEKPLRSVAEGGYGVNYPGEEKEHMRMILLKDAYAIRYQNASFFGERIMPVLISSTGGTNHLSEEAANAIKPTINNPTRPWNHVFNDG